MAEVKAEVTHDVAIDVEAYCTECNGLLETSKSKRRDEILVEPCEKCLYDAKQQGIKEATE